MLDSLLTLTSRRLFWLVLGWVVAVVFDRVVSMITGAPVSFIVLAVVVIPAYVLVAGVYTLIKKFALRGGSSAKGEPKQHA